MTLRASGTILAEAKIPTGDKCHMSSSAQGNFQHIQVLFHDSEIACACRDILCRDRLYGIQRQDLLTAAFCVLHDRAGNAAVRALDLQNFRQAELVELVCQKDDRLKAGLCLRRAARKSGIIIQIIIICKTVFFS